MITMIRLLTVVLAFVLAGCASSTNATPGKKAVKVFLLSGQSNMTGRGTLGWPDTALEKQTHTLFGFVNRPENKETYAFLRNGPKTCRDGWTIRDDVFITLGDWPHKTTSPDGLGDSQKHGGLGPYYGGRRPNGFGPELAIGHLLGDHFDQPVLLVKVAFGGNSLATNFRPPSSGGKLGDKYPKVIKAVQDAIEHLPEIIPGYTEEQGYELAGLLWNQGLSDMGYERSGEYQMNLVNLINDLRRDLKAPGLPTVVAVSGNWGPGTKLYREHLEEYATSKKIPIDKFMKDRGNEFLESLIAVRTAQRKVSTLPEFKGSVVTAETCGCWRPRKEFGGHGTWQHWNANGESYWLIGESMGQAMIGLLNSRQTSK